MLFRSEVKTRKKSTKNTTKQTGSKILVRNVPFQANKGEIEQLFKAFGEIKALRLPKKMTSGPEQHRGFAFIDYVTKSDAKVIIHFIIILSFINLFSCGFSALLKLFPKALIYMVDGWL